MVQARFESQAIPVSLSKINCKVPIAFGFSMYKEQNWIERFFSETEAVP
jgi:hypothetical protein